MKLAVALLLNYVAAFKVSKHFVLDQDEKPGEVNSGHYSWKSGAHPEIVNQTEWVEAALKGYTTLQLRNHKLEIDADGSVEGELPESKKDQAEIFDKRYDYDNLNDQQTNVRIELSQVHIIPLKETNNPKCKPHEFTRAHWTAKLSDNGELVEDTRRKFGEENPRQFKIGDYQATRCLDLALAQMRVGDKLKIMCPAKFAYGGQHVYTHFGSAMIPENSDLTYEIELISCMKKDWNKVHKKILKKEAEKKEEEEIAALPKPKIPVKKSMVEERRYVEAQFKRIDELKDILKDRELQMKDQEGFIQKLNAFYENKKVNKQMSADKDGEVVAQKVQFNKKEEQAISDARQQMTKAEKSAKSAEQAIINEEKTVNTATTLVQNIKIAGESMVEKQQVDQLEQAEQLQEEAGKSVDQRILDRDAAEIKQDLEQPDTEEEKEEDSSPEAGQILNESQVDEKQAHPKQPHKIKVDSTKSSEQLAIEKADQKVKKQKTKDADNKIVASAEKKKANIAQKEVMKVEKKAQGAIDALTEVMKITETTTEQALDLKDKQCFFIESVGKDGSGSNIVLEVGREDAYAPRKTGVYNVALAKRSQADPEQPESKAQQWFYDTKTHTLHSMLYPKKALFEGNNNNLIVFKNRGLKQQKFAYDKVNLEWFNKFTKKSVGIKDFKAQINAQVDIYKDGQNVGTAPFEVEKPQQWLVQYCEQA